MSRLILVTGGSRSGKSSFAQERAEAIAGERVFIATCPRFADDAEMAARVDRHQVDRAGRGWQTLEEERALAVAIASCPAQATILVDCLGLWCNNLMYAAEQDAGCFDEDAASSAAETLTAACQRRRGSTFLVTNEVGLGVIPANPAARQFVDCLGRINQRVAAAADEVYLCSCGIPLLIKGSQP